MTDPPALLGTYTPPPVRVGARAYCRYRRAWCRVTSWTDAPLPWPKARRPRAPGAAGLLVTADLARAIRTESAAALMHWFGVSTKVVCNWRKQLAPGEGNFRTPGSHAAQRAASAAGAALTRGVPVPDETRAARRERARRVGLRLPNRPDAALWTAGQEALLGTLPDADLAAAIGRTPEAVRLRRARAGIPTHTDRRRKG